MFVHCVLISFVWPRFCLLLIRIVRTLEWFLIAFKLHKRDLNSVKTGC